MEFPRDTPQILVYHSGALGDFITALPALKLLSRDRPLALWTRRAHAPLAEAAALAVADHYDVETAAIPDPPADSAFLFVAPGNPLPAALRQRGMTVHAHPARPPDGKCHVVDFHLAGVAAVVGVAAAAGSAPSLSPPRGWQYRAPAAEGAGGARPWVIAPGSGGLRKNWPLARFEEVADALRARGEDVVWLIGPAEEDNELAARMPAASVLWRGLSVTAVVARLAVSSGYVGNDSGISHLAAALGMPTVAVFGPTDPEVWAPRGANVTVVAAPTLGGVSVRSVLDACYELTVGGGR